MNNIAT